MQTRPACTTCGGRGNKANARCDHGPQIALRNEESRRLRVNDPVLCDGIACKNCSQVPIDYANGITVGHVGNQAASHVQPTEVDVCSTLNRQCILSGRAGSRYPGPLVVRAIKFKIQISAYHDSVDTGTVGGKSKRRVLVHLLQGRGVARRIRIVRCDQPTVRVKHTNIEERSTGRTWR